MPPVRLYFCNLFRFVALLPHASCLQFRTTPGSSTPKTAHNYKMLATSLQVQGIQVPPLPPSPKNINFSIYPSPLKPLKHAQLPKRLKAPNPPFQKAPCKASPPVQGSMDGLKQNIESSKAELQKGLDAAARRLSLRSPQFRV